MNKKLFVSIIAVVALVATFATLLVGCNPYKWDAIGGGEPNADVVSNGGYYVQQGKYVYFINGYDTAEAIDNTFGVPVKNAIVRAELVDGKIASLEGTSVIISSAYVTGDVNELSSDYENIVIGTANYELSPYYERLVEAGCPDISFSNGDNAKFYLDHLGRIVFVEKNDTSDPYGLLVAYAKGSSMDAANALKIMTTGGKYLEYNMKSTIRINGESMDSEEAIEELKKSYSFYL